MSKGIQSEVDSVVFTGRWQTRMKAFTFVACACTLVAGMLGEYDEHLPQGHVLSGVKPALKSYFNRMFSSTAGSQHVAVDRQ